MADQNNVFSLRNLLFWKRHISKRKRKRLEKIKTLGLKKSFGGQTDEAFRYQRQRQFQCNIFSLFETVMATFSLERRVWANTRISSFFETEMLCLWSVEDWKRNLRLTKGAFFILAEKLTPFIEANTTRMRQPVTAVKRVAITVYYLADGTSLRTLGNLFGVAPCTACVIIKSVCKAIIKHLLPNYITWPQGDAQKVVIRGFSETWGFPQCIGAIDGTHIPIKAPEQYPKDYFNRKQFHSVVLQAVVDHRYMIRNVNIGWPGSVHDARVFGNSSIFAMGQDGNLFSQDIEWKNIGGKKILPLLIGDPAYPLLPWLMKPFSDNGHLSPAQLRFNYRLSRARMVVECCFGRLKGRWRVLLKKIDAKLNKAIEVALACCVLHNFCETLGQEFDSGLLPDHVNEEAESGLQQQEHNGQEVRSALVSYFS